MSSSPRRISFHPQQQSPSFTVGVFYPRQQHARWLEYRKGAPVSYGRWKHSHQEWRVTHTPYYVVTDFMVFVGMNLTAFLDSLSYKRSSKYRICILGILCQEPSIFLLVQPNSTPPTLFG